MKAIETTARVDEYQRLVPDTPLPPGATGRVRVIILIPEESEDAGDSAYLKAAMASQAFDFLRESGEDIYAASDGHPFHGEG